MSVNNLDSVFIGNQLLNFQSFSQRQKAKCSRIFKYTDFPFNVSEFELELQASGCLFVYKKDGEFVYCTSEPDVANFVRFKSDSVEQGLSQLISEHAILDSQSKVSLWRALINLRVSFIIDAKDEDSALSAQLFEDKIVNGDLAILATDTPFTGLGGVSVHNTQVVSSLADQIVTLSQYITAKYYGELGIVVNGDVKRQYVNETEIRTSTGQPLIWDMLECRRESVQALNEIFGLEVTVELSEHWDSTIQTVQADPEPESEPEPEPEPELEEVEEDDNTDTESNDSSTETDDSETEEQV